MLLQTRILLAFGLSVGMSLYAADAGSISQAEELHKRTEYSASLALLDHHSCDAATDFLIGRNYFMLGDFKKSTDFLQKAVTEAPSNAEYVDWLGRAYGKRAETSNPLLAPGLASKARQNFERSVQLNPKNPDALSDLFDYYLEAPGFLGGGYDKAQEVAKQIAAVDPPEGFFEEAKLAQKRKEFDRAEIHLRQAIAATPQKVGAMLVYAKFLSNQGRTRESDAILAEAQRIQPDSPRVWYARADLFVRERRNLAEARDLLTKYMRATITVDDPPKDEAARLLKQAGGA
jgi:tetratricopeptide (TPR) repeat protein